MNNSANPNNETPEPVKKIYNTPSVKEYGDIGNLVQSGTRNGIEDVRPDADDYQAGYAS